MAVRPSPPIPATCQLSCLDHSAGFPHSVSAPSVGQHPPAKGQHCWLKSCSFCFTHISILPRATTWVTDSRRWVALPGSFHGTKQHRALVPSLRSFRRGLVSASSLPSALCPALGARAGPVTPGGKAAASEASSSDWETPELPAQPGQNRTGTTCKVLMFSSHLWAR